MQRNLWIGAAGFAGAVTRHQVDLLVRRIVPGRFPWGILLVNVSGCFLAAFLATFLAQRSMSSGALRQAATVGFLGAYTTFSTFAYQTVRLNDAGRTGLAASYVVASVGAGLFAAWLGVMTARTL